MGKVSVTVKEELIDGKSQGKSYIVTTYYGQMYGMSVSLTKEQAEQVVTELQEKLNL